MPLTLTTGTTFTNGEKVTPAKLNAAVNSATYTGSLEVAKGGTGATSAAAARTNLGLAIGTDVQAYSSVLGTYAGITPSANVQSYLAAADYAAMRALVLPGYSETIDGTQAGWGLYTAGAPIRTSRDQSTLATHLVFYNTNGNVGSISTTGSSTAYNTSSDRRLKTKIVPAPDCGPVIDQLKVRQYEFKQTPGEPQLGVIAQEAVRHFPQAVTRGNRRDKWMVDYSKFVALLLRETQALRQRVAQLEARETKA